jgi:extracellular matrix regulatory protein A
LNKLVNVGFGNVINSAKLISIISPEAAPIKRMVQTAKDSGMAIDATCGRRTKAVLVMESGHLILSSLLPETIAGRVNQLNLTGQKETQDLQEMY